VIPKYLSAPWVAIAPALGNHLWQSTLFAVTAGLLTLTLRENRARARYWLWLAVSVKFLIPFSLLVGVGSHLAWLRGPSGTKAGLYYAMEEVSQPFTQRTMSMISWATPSTVSANLMHLLPALLAAVWLCGFVVVLFVWFVRWRRISSAIQEAAPLRKGREVEALRRMERVGGMQKRIELLMSRAPLEPGIFGIVRPVLIWPEGLSERLADAHLEAILAHELWHIRRRDNLAAAIHMVVEAIFWFYPLVWWLGARLMGERERACDEEVLELGTERQVYAESILKICEFCVGSPLACVSGVTGADLKRRIACIMSERVARKLDLSRKLLLSAAGLMAVAVPVVFGLMNATQTRAESQAQNAATTPHVYQVVSIKRNKSGGGIRAVDTTDGFTAKNATMPLLIQTAYGISRFRISASGPQNWLVLERYDIQAKMDRSVANGLQKLSPDQRRLEQRRMLQALLADRFKLTVHRETKELQEYSLVIAKNGPKLQESKPGDTYPNGIKGPDGRGGAGMVGLDGTGGLRFQGLPIGTLVGLLSAQLGCTILDKTGLTGNYDFTLPWTPDQNQAQTFDGPAGGQRGTDNIHPPDSSGPSIFTTIQKQLGLMLESQQGPVEVLVIDHAETPSEN
jgi:bla regulator protein blaR1